MDDLLREFVTATNESLDVELVRFEQEPNNAKILDNVSASSTRSKARAVLSGFPVWRRSRMPPKRS
jgi:hypothetical protein